MEVICYPQGVIGKSNLADASKAKPGVEAILDYTEKLIVDILKKFPAGILPPVDKVTQRSKEEVDAVVKGPFNGGRHLYTLGYPV
jgi:creatinine amidohydrolase